MSKINIIEKDYTRPGTLAYSNFTVVVPAVLTQSEEAAKYFDENGIGEFTKDSAKALKDLIIKTEAADKAKAVVANNYGRKIAYELLRLGYTVLVLAVENEEALNEIATWDCLKDKANYDFRYITTGLLENNKKANNCISEVAATRGDCIALVDLDESILANTAKTAANTKQEEAIINTAKAATELTTADKYSLILAPAVTYTAASDLDGDVSKNRVFPASFHYLACAAEAAENSFAEWYAISGYNRGINRKLRVEKTSVLYGDTAVDTLQARKAVLPLYLAPISTEKLELPEGYTTEDEGVNITKAGDEEALYQLAELDGTSYIVLKTAPTKKILINIPVEKAINLVIKVGMGTKARYYLWGNRTAAPLNDTGLVASHFANIRQLCATIKKQLYYSCRRFSFDPNNNTLWINFVDSITPLLEKMKANQGIDNYKISQIASKEKATFTANIHIVPFEAVEDFDITLALHDSLEAIEESDNK